MKISPGKIVKKISKIAIAIIILIFGYFYLGSVAKPAKMEWGVTFSAPYAEGLGLSWKETYLAILDDLQVDNIRLIAYWNRIEKEQGKYDFSELDFQINEAGKRKVKILLALGRRLPRWPECHVPSWAEQLPESTKQEKILKEISAIVTRYKNNPNVVMWQMGNEFFLRRFGDCPGADPEFFDMELATLRKLDSRPIVATDSGELGGWFGSISRGDVFGTTMYRKVYNKYVGYATYPLSPIYYQRRFWLMKFFGRANKIINVELQAEPWSVGNDLKGDSVETWSKTLSPEQFQKNIDYAVASGISPTYLWGAEWWYYAYKVRGERQIWQIAKKLWP